LKEGDKGKRKGDYRERDEREITEKEREREEGRAKTWKHRD